MDVVLCMCGGVSASVSVSVSVSDSASVCKHGCTAYERDEQEMR